MPKWIFFLIEKSIIFQTLLFVLLSPFSVQENKGDELKFFFNNNTIMIENRLSDNSILRYRFDAVGVNQLLAIDEISLNYCGIDHTTKSCTDYVGPYIVRNADVSGSFEEKFTGGWHGKNGDTTGLPTATMREFHCYSNGNLIRKKFGFGYSEKFEILCVNDVMPYNTDFPVLEERVRYIISRNSIDVEVILKAKTDIVISRYYGLQAQKPSWADKIVYHYGNANSEEYDISADSKSKSIELNDSVNKIEFKSNTIPVSFFMSIERNNDLTKGVFVDKKMPWAFTKAYGKSYFNMVNGKELKMQEGEEIRVSGSYRFEE